MGDSFYDENPPTTGILGAFGVTFATPVPANTFSFEYMEELALKLSKQFGGEAYSAREAKALGQIWCFDKTKILFSPVYYFGFINQDDAAWLYMNVKPTQ